MKKKRYDILIVPALAVIILSVLMGFARPSNEMSLKDILDKRTDILQNGYLQKVTMKETKVLLNQIETGSILKKDLENLRNWDPDELDLVKKMDIIKLKKTKDMYGYHGYEALIAWNMTGDRGEYAEKTYYNIVLKNSGNSGRLSLLEPVKKNEKIK